MVKTFKNEKGVRDTTLLDLIPILEGIWCNLQFWQIEIFMEDVDDVREYLAQFDGKDIVEGHRRVVGCFSLFANFLFFPQISQISDFL